MRITRRRAVGGLIGVGVLVLLWAPSFVARTYTSPAQPIDFLARPDKGWQFLYDTVRLSRGARLGSGGPALQVAKRNWRGADRVELVYLEGAVTIPVPAGAPALPARFRTVTPRSKLTWFVHGRIGDGPRRVLGLLDYDSGLVIWDLRRVRRGRAR